jgi:hypothetical protein
MLPKHIFTCIKFLKLGKESFIMPQSELDSNQRAVIEQMVNQVQLDRTTQAMVAGESKMRQGNLSTQESLAAITLPEHAYLQSVDSLRSFLTPVHHLVEPEVMVAAPPPPPPPPLPALLGPFDTGYVSFNNSVPVGGSASLTLYANGNYNFSGHFHDSGFPSYKLQLGWVIVDASGNAYTFAHQGSMFGTIESGSRDDDWTSTGNNPAIAEGWAELARGNTGRWEAYVNWNVQSMIDSITTAIKTAGTVITVVVAIVS